jgi:hypothetical protein
LLDPKIGLRKEAKLPALKTGGLYKNNGVYA